MTYSAAQYLAIAAMIKRRKQSARLLALASPDYAQGYTESAEAMQQGLCELFAESNPSFDAERFNRNCDIRAEGA